MIELFVFINPTEIVKSKLEASIKTISAKENGVTHTRIIPILNMSIINELFKTKKTNATLKERNAYFQMLFQMILDMKAVEFQSGKLGQQYLYAASELIYEDISNYSINNIIKILDDLSIDKELFFEDRNSDLAIQSYRTDQSIADKFNVESIPAAVITNYSIEQEVSSILLNEIITPEIFQNASQTLPNERLASKFSITGKFQPLN